MPYEILINPPAVESKALHWPWQAVKANLDELAALGKEYTGRRLYLLYNPALQRHHAQLFCHHHDSPAQRCR
jgi:gentisate 1,2-dioxygenase